MSAPELTRRDGGGSLCSRIVVNDRTHHNYLPPGCKPFKWPRRDVAVIVSSESGVPSFEPGVMSKRRYPECRLLGKNADGVEYRGGAMGGGALYRERKYDTNRTDKKS